MSQAWPRGPRLGTFVPPIEKTVKKATTVV